MYRPETDRPRIVVYYRTGLSTLDLEKQHQAVDQWGWFRPFEDIAEFTEIEDADPENRAQLKLAISRAWSGNADVLIADIGLLTRDTHFLAILAGASRAYGIKFFACRFLSGEYMPVEHLLGWAEHFAASHSARTREGLAAAKARGVKIGAAARHHAHVARAARTAKATNSRAKHLSIITRIQRQSGAKTLQEIADALTAQRVKTPRGLEKWTPTQVSRVLGPKQKKAGTPNGAPARGENASGGGDGKTRVLH